MKPEKRKLIRDLLDEQDWEARRDATLLAGGRLLRRRRWKRVATQSFFAAVIVIMAGIGILKMNTPEPTKVVDKPETTPKVHYLTDDELLAMFPNTPVGLAKVGGKVVLIFPRPGDKERFVGRF